MKAPKNPLSNTLRSLMIGGWVATLFWWERRSALRQVIDSKFQRDTRNLVIATGAGTMMQFVEAPVAFGLAQWAENRRGGIIQQLRIPRPLRILTAIALLDYTLYWWHFLTHRVPLLWRFHQAHHMDREMDVTTALRFHFGEIAISVIFRAAQMIVIGPSPIAFACWQVFLILCILFHHSNVRLSLRWERVVARALVTPRLHGIHHSIEPSEVNSNWSSGLTVWDWLHGTLRTNVPQEAITIGVAGLRSDEDQGLTRVLRIPFEDGVPVLPMESGFVRQPLHALS